MLRNLISILYTKYASSFFRDSMIIKIIYAFFQQKWEIKYIWRIKYYYSKHSGLRKVTWMPLDIVKTGWVRYNFIRCSYWTLHFCSATSFRWWGRKCPRSSSKRANKNEITWPWAVEKKLPEWPQETHKYQKNWEDFRTIEDFILVCIMYFRTAQDKNIIFL